MCGAEGGGGAGGGRAHSDGVLVMVGLVRGMAAEKTRCLL